MERSPRRKTQQVEGPALKRKGGANVVELRTGQPRKSEFVKKSAPERDKGDFFLGTTPQQLDKGIAIGSLGNKKGTPFHRMKVPAGVLDAGYRRAIDPPSSGHARKKLATFTGRLFAAFLALTPMGAKAASDAMITARENAAYAERARLHLEAYHAAVEAERLQPGEQEIDPLALSPLMRAALDAREGPMPIHSLMSRWLGQGGRSFKIGGEGERTLHIDLGEALEELWQYKNSRSISRGAAAREGLREVVPDFQARLERGELFRSSLTAQLADAYRPGGRDESITRIVARNIDWEAFAEREGVSEHAELLQAAASQLDPLMIYAIYTAEVIPAEGLDAIAQMDLMLRIGGQAYALNLPSLYDRLESKGFSQMTHYPFGTYGGITSVAPYLPDSAYRALQIPEGDAVNFRPNSGTILASEGELRTSDELPEGVFEIDSMRAEEVLTIFNAIKNLARIARDPGARAGLRYIVEHRLSYRLLEVVDMAHNNPEEATNALERWAAHGKPERPVHLDMSERTTPARIARDHGTRGLAAYRALVEYYDRQAIEEAVENRLDPVLRR